MLAEKPKYKLLQDSFLAPNRLPEGAVIFFSGQPGPHMEPMNLAAKQRLDKYYEENPGARLTPVDALPMTMDEVEVVSLPDGKQRERAFTIEELAEGRGAKVPSPTIRSMADAQVAAGGAVDVDEEIDPESLVAQMTEADKAALAEVAAGAEQARAAKAAAAEAAQGKGKTTE